MAVPKYCKFSLRTLEAQRTCLTSAQGDRLLTAGCRARPPPAWLFDDASHTHRSPAGEVPSEPPVSWPSPSLILVFMALEVAFMLILFQS